MMICTTCWTLIYSIYHQGLKKKAWINLICRYVLGFVAFAGTNVVLAICAGALCAFVAPAAAGSGIPEVKAYLNGIDAHSILAPSTLFVKVCLICYDASQ